MSVDADAEGMRAASRPPRSPARCSNKGVARCAPKSITQVGVRPAVHDCPLLGFPIAPRPLASSVRAIVAAGSVRIGFEERDPGRVAGCPEASLTC